MKQLLLILGLTAALLMPLTAQGANPTPAVTPPVTAAGTTTGTDQAKAVVSFLASISNYLRAIGYGVGVLMIVYAGLLYFNSSNQNNPTQAKNAIMAVVIGLILIISSELIVRTTLSFVTTSNAQQGIDKIISK